MKNKSFTLLELLVVIAIIGLLSTIIFVSLGPARERARIAKALNFEAQVHKALGADIVGWWDFNEGEGDIAKDLSGYNNYGELRNNPQWRCADEENPNYTPIGDGCSLEFNGEDDLIYINNSSSLYSFKDSITISAWVKISDYQPQYADIISDWWRIRFGIREGSRPQIFFMLSGIEPHETLYSNSELSFNKWHNLVVTYNGSVLDEHNKKIYLDSVLDRSENRSGELNLRDDRPWSIGRADHTALPGGGGVKGLIAEVRIYNRAIDTAQIQSLYYAGLNNLYVKGQITEREFQERIK